MKRLALVIVLVLVASVGYRSLGSAETGTGTLTLPQPAPTPGQRAPDFTAQDVEGKTFGIEEDGVYVLTFWSTLNKGSNQAQEGFERLAREYTDDARFAVIYVGGTPETDGEPYTTLQDTRGRLTSLYNVKRVPRLFLIRDGEIVLVQNEYFEENEEDLDTALQEALKRESNE